MIQALGIVSDRDMYEGQRWQRHKASDLCLVYSGASVLVTITSTVDQTKNLRISIKEYGGLGLHNLQYVNIALRVRWLWFQKACPEKPWAGLPIKCQGAVREVFLASTIMMVGGKLGFGVTTGSMEVALRPWGQIYYSSSVRKQIKSVRFSKVYSKIGG